MGVGALGLLRIPLLLGSAFLMTLVRGPAPAGKLVAHRVDDVAGIAAYLLQDEVYCLLRVAPAWLLSAERQVVAVPLAALHVVEVGEYFEVEVVEALRLALHSEGDALLVEPTADEGDRALRAVDVLVDRVGRLLLY